MRGSGGVGKEWLCLTCCVCCVRYNKDLTEGHQQAMERLVHEQAQVDEYIQQRKLDTVKPFSSSSRDSLLL